MAAEQSIGDGAPSGHLNPFRHLYCAGAGSLWPVVVKDRVYLVHIVPVWQKVLYSDIPSFFLLFFLFFPFFPFRNSEIVGTLWAVESLVTQQFIYI